jgi:hypothetical protein
MDALLLCADLGHSEVLIKVTDEMPLLLAPRDKFVTLQERISLRNVLIWLHRIDSVSLLMDLFARAELVPGVICIRLSCYVLSIRSICCFGVFVSSRVVLELALYNRVRKVWVSGHCGIHGNEEVDALVSSRSSSVFVGPEPCLPLAGVVTQITLPPWSLETACRQSRMWLKKPNPGLTRYLLRLPRSKLWILVGLITRHCLLNKHLYNIGRIDELICITCGMEDVTAQV